MNIIRETGGIIEPIALFSIRIGVSAVLLGSIIALINKLIEKLSGGKKHTGDDEDTDNDYKW